MSLWVKSDLLVLAFIKNSRKKFLDSYLIKSGDATSGEIFLKLSKLTIRFPIENEPSPFSDTGKLAFSRGIEVNILF